MQGNFAFEGLVQVDRGPGDHVARGVGGVVKPEVGVEERPVFLGVLPPVERDVDVPRGDVSDFLAHV